MSEYRAETARKAGSFKELIKQNRDKALGVIVALMDSEDERVALQAAEDVIHLSLELKQAAGEREKWGAVAGQLDRPGRKSLFSKVQRF